MKNNLRCKALAVGVREVGPIKSMSDLSQLSLTKFACIQDLILERQFDRVKWVMDSVVPEHIQ